MSPRRFTSKTFAFVFNDKQLNRPGRFETVRNRLTVLTVREDGSSGRFPRRFVRLPHFCINDDEARGVAL